MHTIMLLLAIVAFILSVGFGGIVDRAIRGGANKATSLGRVFAAMPKFSRLTISAALQVAFLPFYYGTWGIIPLALMGFIFVLLVAATSGPHGNQMDLGKSPEENEDVNYADKIFGREGFWSEFWGLSLTGFVITLPMGIAMAVSPLFVPSANTTLAILFGVIYSVIGWTKGACYHYAQKAKLTIPALWVPGPDEIGRNPDGGEFIWGTVKYGTLGLLTLAYVLLS